MRAMFKRHRGEVNSIAFSPDGRSLVSGSDDGSVRIWSIRDGSSKELTMTDDANGFYSVVFSPDGRYIAAGDRKNSLWIWGSRTHKCVAIWMGHFSCVWCVGFTPDGNGLMSGGEDRKVKYWDVSSLGTHGAASGREVVNPEHSFPLIRTFSGHSVRCCFTSLHVFCRDFHIYRAALGLLLSSLAMNGLLAVHRMEVCVYGIFEQELGSWKSKDTRREF